MAGLLYGLFRNQENDLTEFIQFTEAQLDAYTASFNGHNFIGRGAFGPVYQGVIRGMDRHPNLNGQHVAVKRSRNEVKLESQWQAEILHLGNLVHPNIIKLIGSCQTEENYYLVYRFMPNGDVKKKLKELGWKKTIKIIKGVAGAIQHLHGLNPPLIHRDLKLENILLDKDDTPKLADFGRATPEGEGESATREDDIRSFGEMIIQLINKDENRYCIGSSVKWNLGEYARRCANPSEELVHAKFTKTGRSKQAAMQVIEIALGCVKPLASERPTIDEVVQRLASV